MSEAYLKLIHSEVSALRGVGAKRAEAFARLGIYTVGDLLRHFPRAYQNRGNVRSLSEAIPGENCSYLLTVGTAPRSAMLKNRKTITKFRAFDESGTVEIVYFNSRYLENTFRIGETHRFWGKVTREKGKLTMSSPLHEVCVNESELPDFTPVYPLSSGLTQGFVAEVITSALARLSEAGTPELLPTDLRTRLCLPQAETAYHKIHHPQSMTDIESSRRYFSAEELYLFSLGLSATKHRKKCGTPPPMKAVDLGGFASRLGFPLTGAQERSIREIHADMTETDLPMSRLLSGDVGSGKTAVAAAAIFIALQNGCQAALMAPTEILASQHAASLTPLFESMGYRVGLLLGSQSAATKRDLRRLAEEGKLHLLIGTHSLLTEDTVFRRLGLVITDEQHRFGVSQRAGLGKANREGNDPHVLVMSATPIPRTLALILYGELSLSMLDELPPGRQRVDTFVVDDSYRPRLTAFIDKQISEGGQVYVVCPAVETKEDGEGGDLLRFTPDGRAELDLDCPALKSALEHSQALKAVFPHRRVGLIHGRMKGQDKDRVMRDFAAGELDILVATTVIEVGVNVPNASLMIVENAERFGLAQLHQLRGRVGRGSRKAYCVLVSSGGGEVAEKRLQVMKTTYDGYKIAEFDLNLRGPGDYFPSRDGNTRQHGSFGCLLNADMEMLKEAMASADKTLQDDPALEKPENRFAADKMRALFAADERAMQ